MHDATGDTCDKLRKVDGFSHISHLPKNITARPSLTRWTIALVQPTSMLHLMWNAKYQTCSQEQKQHVTLI